MDISSLYTADRHNEGAKMRVIDEMGQQTDFFITLAGQDSDIWIDHTRKNQHKAIRKMLDKSEDDEKDNSNLEMILEATLAWEGVEIEFSKEAALVLYQKAPYIVDQAILFINNRVNFIVS